MTQRFTPGLSAFPLTPLRSGRVDEGTCRRLIANLAGKVDSIGVLGSTGSYMYLTPSERQRVTELAVEEAGTTPVLVGVGALALRDVLTHLDVAVQAGAAGVLLAPVSYQPLTSREVVELYRAVSQSSDLPLVIYDNPTTTGFTFDTETYCTIADLPGVIGFKIPPLPGPSATQAERLDRLREALPQGIRLGVSGDATAVPALIAGADGWYSVLAGTYPELAAHLDQLARNNPSEARAEQARLQPLWDLFAAHGSQRAITALAARHGLIPTPELPLPLLPLEESPLLSQVTDLLTPWARTTPAERTHPPSCGSQGGR